MFLAAFAALGQTPSAPTTGADTNLALIRFEAVQKRDPVTDLRPEDIEIRVDGKPREITFFQGGSVHPRTIPFELSLLFDCNLAAMSTASLSPQAFHEGLLNEFPNMSVAIYGFVGGPVRLTPLTRNHEELYKAIGSPMFVHPVGTFLLDHISSLAIEASSTTGPAVRMLAVFSERHPEQASTTSAADQDRYQRTIETIRGTGVTVYPVLLKTPLAVQVIEPDPPPERADTVPGPQFTPPDPSPEWRAIGDFISLGEGSGGRRVELLGGGNMLPTVLNWLADQIRHEYVVGFEYSTSTEKKQHKIKVNMRDKKRGKIKEGKTTLVY
jgi:hypothetical protein